MEDRSVEFPQRYRLKKVEGTDDIYDLIPAPGTITAEGTLINKKALLQDATAALFQLSGDTALPDKVFEILSKAALVGEDGSISTIAGIGVSQVKIVSGTYIGNGKYGESNPNSLSFDGKPKLVIVFDNSSGGLKPSGNNTSWYTSFIWSEGFSKLEVKTDTSYTNTVNFEQSGNGLSWYSKGSNGADKSQLNESGVSYTYFAIIFG